MKQNFVAAWALLLLAACSKPSEDTPPPVQPFAFCAELEGPFSARTTARVDTSIQAVILLDFDGHYTASGLWASSYGPIVARPAGYTPQQIAEVVNRISDDYAPFSVLVTTDSAQFHRVPQNRRQRCVIGRDMGATLGNVGGVAFNNSFKWDADEPAFVQADKIAGHLNAADAAAHEIGHTLGLRHATKYSSTCTLQQAYHSGQGTGVLAWAPLMGQPYGKISGWWDGTRSGCQNKQDDVATIAAHLPLRTDDIVHCRQVTKGVYTGTLENPQDEDPFVLLPGTYTISARSGGNTDIRLELVSPQGVFASHDDSASLHVSPALLFVQSPWVIVRVRVTARSTPTPLYAQRGHYTLTIE